jgi:hypothetical protein
LALGPSRLFTCSVLAEAIATLPPSVVGGGSAAAGRGAKMSNVWEAALKACAGGVASFPTFTSFSEKAEAAKKFPFNEPGPDEVKVFFQLNCQGRHRVGDFAAEEVQGEDEVLLQPFVPLSLESVVESEGRTMFCLSDLATVSGKANPMSILMVGPSKRRKVKCQVESGPVRVRECCGDGRRGAAGDDRSRGGGV